MRLAVLPYKETADDPEYGERVVMMPESWLERLALRFVPGKWHDHIMFGWLLVVDVRAPKGQI